MPDGAGRRIARGFVSMLRHGWTHFRTFLRALDVRRYGHDATSLRLLFWTLCLRNEKPFDIIQCHFGPIGQLTAKLRDIGAIDGRLVTVFHGVDISAYVRDQRDYYDFLFATGDLFQPISQAWSRKLVDLGCDAARIEIHHMGIDSARYPFQLRRYEAGQTLRVLTVGRMVEKKGIADGLRAVAEAIHQGVPVHYTIIGDGPLRGELERLVRDLRIEAQVEFGGWRDQAVVARLMAENDVLLAPSVTSSDGDQEGIPVTLMEAMASGMLVVSTQHSGIPELVEHAHSGLLVPERDVAALTQALLRLVHSPELWPAMCAAAREAVQREFEIATLNDRLVDCYCSLLEHAEPGTRRAMFATRRRFATN